MNYILEPNEMDVLLGREASSWNHGGNQRFRALVNDKLDEYDKATTRMEKMLIVAGIVTAIQNTGGRFIKRDDDSERWFEVNRTTAIEKVGHAIRDKKAKERRKQQYHEAGTQRRPEQKMGPEISSPLYDRIPNSLDQSKDRPEGSRPQPELKRHKSFPPSRPMPSVLPAVMDTESGVTTPQRAARMGPLHSDYSMNPTEDEMVSRRQQVLLQQRKLLHEASRTLEDAEAYLVARNDTQAMDTLQRTDIATKALIASIQLTTAASHAGHGLLPPRPPPPSLPAPRVEHSHQPFYDPDHTTGYGSAAYGGLSHGYGGVAAATSRAASIPPHLHHGSTGATAAAASLFASSGAGGSYAGVGDQGRLAPWPPPGQPALASPHPPHRQHPPAPPPPPSAGDAYSAMKPAAYQPDSRHPESK